MEKFVVGVNEVSGILWGVRFDCFSDFRFLLNLSLNGGFLGLSFVCFGGWIFGRLNCFQELNGVVKIIKLIYLCSLGVFFGKDVND